MSTPTSLANMNAPDSAAIGSPVHGKSVPSLSITGTLPGHWRDWVERLWPGRAMHVVDARTPAPTDAATPVVTFIESPINCLAMALASGSDIDITLTAWETSARGLLERLHNDPANFVVMDWQEACQTPEGLAQALQRVLPGHPPPRLVAAPQIDPVWVALASHVIAERPGLSALSEELAVSCLVLEGSESSAKGTNLSAIAAYRAMLRGAIATRVQLGEAQETLARKESRQREQDGYFDEQTAALKALIATQQSELSALQGKCTWLERVAKEQSEHARVHADRLQEQLEAERTRGETIARDCRDLGEKLSIAQNLAEGRLRDAELQLVRLHEAQAEMTRLSTLVDETTRGLAAERESRQAQATACAALVEQLASSEFQCRTLMADWAAMQQVKAYSDRSEGTMRASLQRADALCANLRSERDALALAEHETRAQSDLLLTQLHILQARLARSESALNSPRAAAKGFAIGSVQLIGTAAEGSHRHADLLLQGLNFGASILKDTPLRLVEHNGHAGLVLFRSPGNATWLSAWAPSGSEGAPDHLLLVPEDQPARTFILGLGSTDWARLIGTLELVQQQLAANDEPTARDWAFNASRLIQVLDALPARVRYDAIRTSATAGQPTIVELVEATFGDRRLGDLSLVVADTTDGLEWRLHERACTAPCLAWPVSAQGEAAPVWRLPVGAAATADVKRRVWAGLNASDRELLLGLLDALCSQAAVAPRATLWRIEARRTLASIRKANLARRLLRRIAKT